jgi:predicted ATPase
MIHLKSITIRTRDESVNNQFPFALDIIRSMKKFEFDSEVTFFVGENGSGKSTVLESLACAIGSITIGSESVRTDETLAQVRKLSRYFQLAWSIKTQKGFFLRAEDFFGYVKTMRKTRQYLQSEKEKVESEALERSEMAAFYARAPYNKELAAIRSRYGDGLDTRSHGEGYLDLFQSRFIPGGLYLLDEPESALSPTRQLSFLAALKQMVEQNSQFIIATHSPIILAFPGASIWSFDDGNMHRVRYDDLEHVTIVREFLQNPQAFLRHL